MIFLVYGLETKSLTLLLCVFNFSTPFLLYLVFVNRVSRLIQSFSRTRFSLQNPTPCYIEIRSPGLVCRPTGKQVVRINLTVGGGLDQTSDHCNPIPYTVIIGLIRLEFRYKVLRVFVDSGDLGP